MAFIDELDKIAANVATMMPVSQVTTGLRPTSPLKPAVKSTNYTQVNTQPPAAAYDSAQQAKSTPPPPVKT